MKIETPRGSRNFIHIYKGGSGDLVVSINTTDSTGLTQRASVELHGAMKGEIESKEVQQLYKALGPLAY